MKLFSKSNLNSLILTAALAWSLNATYIQASPAGATKAESNLSDNIFVVENPDYGKSPGNLGSKPANTSLKGRSDI